MIKYTSNKQISIEEFSLPFSGELSKDNRWLKLALELPWDEMVKVYLKRMSLTQGRGAINPRVAIGALIIKHMKSLSDEATVDEIRENPYLQYFLGYEKYTYDVPFVPSLFVSFRRRMGKKEFDALTESLIVHVKECLDKRQPKPKNEGGHSNDRDGADHKSENKGHLIVDATVAPADIKYPTDLDILNEAREKSELLIDLLYKDGLCPEKPRTYRRIARREYLKLSKQRKKTRKKIRAGLRKQLGYLRRNLGHIEGLLGPGYGHRFPLAFKYQRMYWVIGEVYRQQKEMYDAKGHSTAGIKFSGRKLGRPALGDKSGEKQRKQKARQRCEVEGEFGESKRRYNLNCVKAKRSDTSGSWIGAVFFVMNIAHWMRVIFLSFFKKVILQPRKMKILMKSGLFKPSMVCLCLKQS